MSISAAKLKKPEVIEVYSQTTWIYDLWGALTETRARQVALEQAHIRNGETVLEVAVGTGLTFREILLANPEGENFGIDLTRAMLAKAQIKRRLKRAKPITNLPQVTPITCNFPIIASICWLITLCSICSPKRISLLCWTSSSACLNLTDG